MAGLLNYGAGAYAGLEDILDREYKRQVEERLLAAQAESARHNQAEEGLQGRTLDMNDLLRRDTLASQDAARQAEIKNKTADNLRAGAVLRGPGAPVLPEERSREMEAGIPSGVYKQTSTYEGMSGDDASEPVGENMFSWVGKPDKAPNPANLQVHTVKYLGKPTEANFNPDTGKWTLSTGEDITGKFEHYERPPQEVGIWSSEGYVPRSQALREARQGNPVQPQETAATRTMQEGARMLQPHIDDLKDQASVLEQAGLFGPVMSRVRHLAERAGTIDGLNDAIASDPELSKDRRIGKFATSLGLLATGAGRVHGGARGGGSPQMLEHFKHLLNDSSSLDMFLGRLDAIDDYMGTYAAGPGAAGSSSGGGLPQVGGTFQGGKVLSVTPVK